MLFFICQAPSSAKSTKYKPTKRGLLIKPRSVLNINTEEIIALRRLNLILVEEETTSTPEINAALLAEFAHVGIRVRNPENLNDSVIKKYKTILSQVKELRGERGTYTPLFSGFPNKLPEMDNGRVRFLLAASRLVGKKSTDEEIREALDFSSIGWWPASSVPQDEEQTLLDRAVQEILPGDTYTKWIDFQVVDKLELTKQIKNYMNECFTSKASLRADVREDLEKLVQLHGASFIDAKNVVFRETRTMLLKLIWQKDKTALLQLDVSPDDLLRLFADLTGSDVSLHDKITFPKFKRAERRLIVTLLDKSTRLNDVFRKRELWLSISKGLHVKEYPTAKNANAVFDKLRKTRHDKASLASRFETTLKTDYKAAISLAEKEAPGVLVRSLRRLMHLSASEAGKSQLLKAVEKCGENVPMRMLLAARANISDNGKTYPRTVFLKSGKALSINNAVGHLAVNTAFQKDMLNALDKALIAQTALKESWAGEKIYIAPELTSVLLPDQLRNTSKGLVQVERGSRLPLGNAKAVRVFVHWKDADRTTDLDLSGLTLDANFKVVSHVSYTNLVDNAMQHSGDITSAPLGAEEFLDIDLAKAKKQAKDKNWRYMAPSILRYAGDTFDDLAEANAGWMLRNEVKAANKVFDPKTVENAFELTGGARTAVPFLLDLETDEILYIDVYLGGAAYANVEREGANISSLAKGAFERKNLKVSVAELALYHILGRDGEIVSDKEEATITFGLTDTDTYNALKPEKILSELL